MSKALRKPRVVGAWQDGRLVNTRQVTVSHPQNFFEAARPDVKRQRRTDRGDGNAVLMRSGEQLRIQARHLDENHDLARGILDVLVNRTIGRGIRFEPQVRNVAGDLHDEMNEQLLDLHTRWSESPTVTGEYTRADAERLLARTWFRDGEAFKVYHMGMIPSLRHHLGRVPLSVELMEPDFCPLGYSDPANGVLQGIRANGWGRPVRYFFHKYHPGSPGGAGAFSQQGYKEVGAEFVNHLKFTRRIGQRRGESVFSAVLLRLDDLKDYEEAERIAARIAAKLVGYVKKGQPDMYGDENLPAEARQRQAFEDGMVLYDMMPGEEVGLFDNTKRPNPALADFRAGQLRAAAAGTMTSYSSASKDYNGTYSAQRQELVEQQENYEVLQDYFVSHSCKPDYQRFIAMTVLAGLDVPGDVDWNTLFDVACYGTAMPWVDPQKEARAKRELLDAGLTSHSEVIRQRGGNPSVVFAQIKRDKERMSELGIEPKPVHDNSSGANDDKGKEED